MIAGKRNEDLSHSSRKFEFGSTAEQVVLFSPVLWRREPQVEVVVFCPVLWARKPERGDLAMKIGDRPDS